MTGYKSKRAAAQDKLDNDDLTIAYQSGYYDGKKAAQPAQEPDYYGLTSDHLWMSITKDHYNKLKPEFRMACYTTPPQRPWVGLTAQEAAECWTTSATQTWKNFEAKLKEKNT